MRSTFRIDDDLVAELKARARKEKTSLTQLLNRMLRVGMRGGRAHPSRRRPYREETFAMGAPRVGLDKALAMSAAAEDAEIVRKLALRK